MKKLHFSPTEHLIPILNERAGLSLDTKLNVYEEIKPNDVRLIDDMSEPLDKVLNEPTDGNIICYERADLTIDKLPTCKDYFE